MALTRKFLAALGIEADKIDEIISAHAETVTALKGEAADYKEDAQKYATTKAELDKLKAVTEGKDYDALKTEYEKYKADVEAAKAKALKEAAYRVALKDANLSDKGIEKAVKYAEWGKIEVDEEGNLKDAKDHVKAAREEWAEYIVKQDKKGAETSNPPGGTDGGSTLTKEEIYKKDEKGRYVMSTAERQKALAELMANEE